MTTPLPSPYSSPCRSPNMIVLDDTIAEEGFVKMERELWISFSLGRQALESLINFIRSNHEDFDFDCQVVLMWFESLIKIHRDKDYAGAISILDDMLAVEIACECVNTIFQRYPLFCEPAPPVTSITPLRLLTLPFAKP